MKQTWTYLYQGNELCKFVRDDQPEIGSPVFYVGRHNKLAPVEHFIIESAENGIITLRLINEDSNNCIRQNS